MVHRWLACGDRRRHRAARCGCPRRRLAARLRRGRHAWPEPTRLGGGARQWRFAPDRDFGLPCRRGGGGRRRPGADDLPAVARLRTAPAAAAAAGDGRAGVRRALQRAGRFRPAHGAHVADDCGGGAGALFASPCVVCAVAGTGLVRHARGRSAVGVECRLLVVVCGRRFPDVQPGIARGRLARPSARVDAGAGGDGGGAAAAHLVVLRRDVAGRRAVQSGRGAAGEFPDRAADLARHRVAGAGATAGGAGAGAGRMAVRGAVVDVRARRRLARRASLRTRGAAMGAGPGAARRRLDAVAARHADALAGCAAVPAAAVAGDGASAARRIPRVDAGRGAGAGGGAAHTAARAGIRCRRAFSFRVRSRRSRRAAFAACAGHPAAGSAGGQPCRQRPRRRRTRGGEGTSGSGAAGRRAGAHAGVRGRLCERTSLGLGRRALPHARSGHRHRRSTRQRPLLRAAGGRQGRASPAHRRYRPAGGARPAGGRGIRRAAGAAGAAPWQPNLVRAGPGPRTGAGAGPGLGRLAQPLRPSASAGGAALCRVRGALAEYRRAGGDRGGFSGRRGTSLGPRVAPPPRPLLARASPCMCRFPGCVRCIAQLPRAPRNRRTGLL